MPKVDMVWTGPDKTFPGQKRRRMGDTFSAARGDARTFKALGWATDAPAQAVPVPATPAPQPPVQAPAPAATATQAREPVQRRTITRNLKAEDEKPATRRTYRRRDMKAED